ncbi:DUF2281 domain-containing protein [Pedobacter alpinus]|uniref:DUF2281 domain-containing protein n=1 Tax=Pedobacter alpinus TaxID=1590643 RepID=A0ABW5TQZ1_9SPHI
MTSLTLYTKLETLPPNLKKEAKNFIESLIKKTNKQKEQQINQPKFGSLKGKITLSEDFDDSLDVFNDYM